MKERLSKLLTIKSLVTLAVTGVFCTLSAMGIIGPEQFMTVFVTIIGFYFGTQAEKQNSRNGDA